MKNDLLKEVETLIAAATQGGGLSYPQKSRVQELTRLILHAEVRQCNCTDRFLDALFMCRKQLKTYGIMKPCNYKLKNNVVLQFQNNVYTNANLTDEVAEAYLTKYPKTTYFAEKKPIEVSEKEAVESDEPVKRSEGDDLTEAVEAIKDAHSRGIGMMEIRERMKLFQFSNGDTLASRGLNEAIKIFKESVNEESDENINA